MVQGGPASSSSQLNAGSRFLGRVKSFRKRPLQAPAATGKRLDAIAGGCSARLGGSHPAALNDLFLGGCVPELGNLHLVKAGGQRLGTGAAGTLRWQRRADALRVLLRVLVALSRDTGRFCSSCPPGRA